MASFTDTERLKRIILSNETYEVDTTGKEVVVLLLSGGFEFNNKSFYRKDVWSNARGLSLADQGVINLVVNDVAEICVIEAKSTNKVDIKYIDDESITKKKVGKDNFFRNVETILDNKSGLSNLIVGETYKPKGNWSSWPPHKHDTYVESNQSKQREIYLYKFMKPDGFGIQMIYETIDDPKVFFVKENTEIKIEKGYHPVVSSPHSEMYYLWVLFGDNSFKVETHQVYAESKL